MAMGFILLEKSEPIAHIISQKLKKLWVFAELLLFVLVGAQVNIHVAWEAGAAGALVILVGLLFRSVGTYLSLLGTPLNRREKLFCVVAYIPKATVQAAIGAIPLAAGVASGETILAIAVLSILLTAPVGAIGIVVFGRKALDVDKQSVYRFRDLREKQGLPQVGERIRNKESGAVWKVIEEKEIWLPIRESDEGKSQPPNEPRLIPAISQRYWKEEPKRGTDKSKTTIFRYSIKDPLFQKQWEILYDW
jgi:Kef-type K+ transport system membrane component KefB